MRIWALLLAVLLVACGQPPGGPAGTSPAAGAGQEVVVYGAQDQIYGEEILDRFEQETGIRVLAKWDAEATKTTGLVNAIRAEAAHPRADVFWNNEVGHTIALMKDGLIEPYESPNRQGIPAEFLDPEGYWTGIAARARVLLVNKNKVAPEDYPDSIFDLTDPKWKGRVAIARPLFGTTLTHFAALYQTLGEEKTKQFAADLLANEALVAEGNAHVKDLVVNGQVDFGLTDTDDSNVALKTGAPVEVVFPDQGPDQMGAFLIPNTIVMIKGAPHPEAAKKLIDFLVSQKTEELLAQGRSAQLPLHEGAAPPPDFPQLAKLKPMQVDYEKLGETMLPAMEFLREQFLR